MKELKEIEDRNIIIYAESFKTVVVGFKTAPRQSQSRNDLNRHNLNVSESATFSE